MDCHAQDVTDIYLIRRVRLFRLLVFSRHARSIPEAPILTPFILPVCLKVEEGSQGHPKVVQRAALAVLTIPSCSPHRDGCFEKHLEPVQLQGEEKHCNLYCWIMSV